MLLGVLAMIHRCMKAWAIGEFNLGIDTNAKYPAQTAGMMSKTYDQKQEDWDKCNAERKAKILRRLTKLVRRGLPAAGLDLMDQTLRSDAAEWGNTLAGLESSDDEPEEAPPRKKSRNPLGLAPKPSRPSRALIPTPSSSQASVAASEGAAEGAAADDYADLDEVVGDSGDGGADHGLVEGLEQGDEEGNAEQEQEPADMDNGFYAPKPSAQPDTDREAVANGMVNGDEELDEEMVNGDAAEEERGKCPETYPIHLVQR